jgi:hypothetical protein
MNTQAQFEYSKQKALIFKATTRAAINTEIDDTKYVAQDMIDRIMSRVNCLDFTPHGYKLEKEYHWSSEKINHAIKIYKEWLVLQVFYENYSFAPSELIDDLWHIHILDTRKYMSDCNSIKGEFIHHYPYFGLTDQENESVLASGFELTKKLYMKHFDHDDLGFEGDHAASCGCRSGNGSSCR